MEKTGFSYEKNCLNVWWIREERHDLLKQLSAFTEKSQ